MVEQVLSAGCAVKVLARDPRHLGSWASRVEVHTGDALRDPQLAEAMRGARAVFSSVGASVQPSLGAGRRGYASVDVPANLRLIEAAKEAGVPRFVYVSLVQTPKASATAYVRAHEAIVAALRSSTLDWWGAAPTNPIADEDLAKLACEQLRRETIDERELAIGGPETITRRRIAELACEAVGRGTTMGMPESIGHIMAFFIRPLSPRMSDLLRFVLAVGAEDAVGPARGTTTLAETFAKAMAQRRGARSLSS